MTTPITYANIWAVGAATAGLDKAADSWRGYAKQIEGTADAVDAQAGAVYDGPWAGQTADAFNQHRVAVTTDLRQAATLARRQADHLQVAAGTLRMGERALVDALTQLTRTVRAQVSVDGSQITFYPLDDAQSSLVHQGAAHARHLRRDIDQELALSTAGLRDVATQWAAIASTWETAAAGTNPFSMPAEAAGTSIIRDGNTAIINTGPGSDTVHVRTDPDTGAAIVEVNGVVHRFPAGAAIVVRAGDGDDTITVAPDTNLRLTLLGGAGRDTIRGGAGDETILGHTGSDSIHAGGGNDWVSGGAHNDYIDGAGGHDRLMGGEGNDVIYGLSGHDRISGGAGQDYLEGGTGSDTIHGGADNDVVSGGRDGDRLYGGGGADRLYAGLGADRTYGGTGADTSYAERGDHHDGTERVVTIEIRDLGMDIRIEGSAEFQERVQADLDMLRASPAGQEMLAELDAIYASGDGGDDRSLTIVEDTRNHAWSTTWREGFLWLDQDERYTVGYKPDRLTSVDQRPPIAGLFHEFAHVYDYGNDTLAPGTYMGSDNPNVPNRERAAVGLPVDLDGDGVAEGLYPDHPVGVTENALRREMGWPERRKY